MCEEPIEEWNCILNCNTNKCLVLDEENCECVIDPDCELEKFCKGNPEDCKCTEKDGGSWCSALTDDSVKTWIFAFAYDSLNTKFITNIGDLFFTLGGSFVRYRLDHICREWYPGTNSDNFSWEFDNMLKPTKILYRCIDMANVPCTNIFEFERDLIKLNQDTLILSFDQNAFLGWIAYIPYKNQDTSSN